MAITVKHTKVSLIPDSGDDSLIEPSDWNDDHVLTGTIPVENGGTGAATLTGYVKGTGTTAMTASATIPNTDITGLGTASTKDAGSPLGVATLDAGGKVPVSELPAAVLGALSYQGTWNASTNTPTLTSSTGTKGYYYVVAVAGSTDLDGITDWQVGDWAVYNGTAWQKVDNTESVTSVNGQTGAVSITLTGLGGGTIATQNANSVAITGGSINGTTIGATTAADITGNTINANTKVVSPDYYAQSILGGNLRTSGGTSLVNWDGGGSGNVTVNGGLNANPANKNVSLAPTGTGSVTVNPATAGTIDNMAIGGTTASAGSFTNLSVTGTTSFDGSQGTAGQVLTSAGSGNTPTWTTPTVGTVTSVSGTAGRITSTGGATPVIDLASGVATAGTTGSSTLIPVVTIDTYGRVTGITTAANPQGTVTSVTGTSPVVSSGGATPAISLASGYGDTQNPYASKTANYILAAPNGSSGVPTFRAVVAADIPTLNQNTTGTASNVTGTVAIANGGTGATTRQNAMDALAGAVTSGQYLRGNGTDVVMSAIQAADVPTLNQNTTGSAATLTTGRTIGMTGDVTWTSGSFNGSGNVTGTATLATVTAAKGGTGQTSYAVGDLLYASTSSALSKLADVATGNALISGGVGVAPSYGKIGLTTHISGTLAIGNGGTGQTTATAAFNALNPMTTTGDILYEASPTTAARLGIGSTGQVLTVAGGLPSWATPVGSNIVTQGLYEMANTISANYTIGAGNNAMSAGPITVNTGVTVTVPTGSTWVIV
jgi:hypothetical protein